MIKSNMDAKQIDAILPQTQCGLCTYNGCMPYAEALANQQAEINLCPPGGVKGLLLLAELLGKDAGPFIAEMESKAKSPSRAIIDETECIGCTKCINACPVDAIIGSGKLMHTVISDECTGCELCITPCPVDCIDMVPITDNVQTPDHYRKRYQARQERLQQEHVQQEKLSALKKANILDNNIDFNKSYIAAALVRAKKKNA
jgi:H+/Na+-translocating ferredoxin:NAD+ oxidoreductase subunit B